MTKLLFQQDAYLREATATVQAHSAEGGIVVDQSVFYPTGGGQPGDAGWIRWADQELAIATTVKGEGGTVVLVPAEATGLPAQGTEITQVLDWERRHKHMRLHTALHLLSVVLPFGVTGGQISSSHARLDFDMPEAPADRDAVAQDLNRYVTDDLRVSEGWITEEELNSAPHLVKTMAVKPPKGAGDVRLIRIGEEDDWIDLQPCGGTHVARTGEIGALRLGKIEKKGRQNSRVYIHLDA